MNKHPGVTKKTIPSKEEHAAMVSVMNPNPIMVSGWIVPKKKKLRKPRALETRNRKLEEKQLEKEIIWFLALKGCIVAKSGESAVYNSKYVLKGMSDLIVFNPMNKRLWFVEVKTTTGVVRKSQIAFKNLCEDMGLNHLVARSVADTAIILT